MWSERNVWLSLATSAIWRLKAIACSMSIVDYRRIDEQSSGNFSLLTWCRICSVRETWGDHPRWGRLVGIPVDTGGNLSWRELFGFQQRIKFKKIRRAIFSRGLSEMLVTLQRHTYVCGDQDPKYYANLCKTTILGPRWSPTCVYSFTSGDNRIEIVHISHGIWSDTNARSQGLKMIITVCSMLSVMQWPQRSRVAYKIAVSWGQKWNKRIKNHEWPVNVLMLSIS